MRIEDIEYFVEEQRMVGYLAVDDFHQGPRPCVLVCHDGPGLDDYVKGQVVRLAGLGYLAFALDYQGDGKPKPPAQAMPIAKALLSDRALTKHFARAGLEIMLAQDKADPSRVAALGYCAGAIMAVELARDGADLKAVVGFHPGMPASAPEETRNIKARILMCCGSEDPFFSRENRRDFELELVEAGVSDWRIELYGGVGHRFTNPRSDAYDKIADRCAWRSAIELFEEAL